MKPKKKNFKRFNPKQDKLDKLLNWVWQASPWNKGRVQQIVKEKIEKMIEDAKKKSV